MQYRRRTTNLAYLALTSILIFFTAHFAQARPEDKAPVRRPIAVDETDVLVGRPVGGMAKADTVQLLGGSQGDGDFQTNDGQPDWDGWGHKDLTADENFWNASTFRAIDGVYSAYVGQEGLPPCNGSDLVGGYGNDYSEVLDIYVDVPSGTIGNFIVYVSADLDVDIEEASETEVFDFLSLEVETAPGIWARNNVWHGKQVLRVENLPLHTDYYPGDKIHLRWLAFSDEGWSDEDCFVQTTGHSRIDNIEVDVPGMPLVSEDFESGTLGKWSAPLDHLGAGDFAHVWPQLRNIDDCADNLTPVVAFVDDDIVVPGTGGSTSSWTYGPGGFVVNANGGLLPGQGILDQGIDVEVTSPVIHRGVTRYDGVRFEFDILGHLPRLEGIFYEWKVRSAVNEEDLEFASWTQSPNVYYTSGNRWYRQSVEVGQFLVQDWEFMQVSLGILDHPDFNGGNPTPAPYFDNVSVKTYPYEGPLITRLDADLAQDSFPENPTIDLINLAANDIRFDMARNIALPTDAPCNVPGDSITFTVTPGGAGASLVGLPRVYVAMKANPLFDGVRSLPAGFTQFGNMITGYVDAFQQIMDMVPVPDGYAFDLPDDAFFFPGDKIQYYIEAEDNLGGVSRTSTLPADITDFGNFNFGSTYPGWFTVRGLPSLKDESGIQPEILLINDYNFTNGLDEWTYALAARALYPGEGYDVYNVTRSSEGLGNGIGGRATADHLAGYQTILYNSGSRTQHTLSAGYCNLDPGTDVGVLDDWLNLGDKSMFLTGDNLASDLIDTQQPLGYTFLTDRIGVKVTDAGNYVDLSTHIQTRTPLIALKVPNNLVFFDGYDWVASGQCPSPRTFDVVEPLAGTEMLASWDLNNGFASATLKVSGSNAQVIYMPYGFETILDDSPAIGQPVRALILNDILNYFAGSNTPPGADIPDVSMSSAVRAQSGPAASVFTLPNGSGARLDEARAMDGTRVDASVLFTVNDVLGDPVIGYPRQDLKLEPASDLTNELCDVVGSADDETDGNGQATFSGTLRAGGYTQGEGLKAIVGETSLASDLSGINFNSPDIDGNFFVNLTDMVLFASDVNAYDASQVYDYRSDFVWDGVLDLSDLVLMDFGMERGGGCEGSLAKSAGESTPSMIELIGPKKAPPSAKIGIYFDPAGTQTTLIPPPGPGIITAYIVLHPDQPTGVRGAAWGTVNSWNPKFTSIAETPNGPNVIRIAGGIEEGMGTCLEGGLDRPVLLGTYQFFHGLDGWTDLELTPHPSSARYDGFVYADCWGEQVSGLNVRYEGPATVLLSDPGTIEVVVDPSGLAAPWTLTGPDGYSHDGIGDETLINRQPGSYDIVWGNVPDNTTPADAAFNLAPDETIPITGLYNAILPTVDVQDVPNDQGGQVRLIWNRSGYDAPGSPVTVTGYEIYRKEPVVPPFIDTPPLVARIAGDRLATSTTNFKALGWDFLATVPAHGDEDYQYVASTLCDYSELTGPCLTYFKLIVATPDPFTFFETPEFFGFSIDNLAPGAPQKVIVEYVANGNLVGWNLSTDGDVAYYRIYRDDGAKVEVVVHETTEISWIDPDGTTASIYRLAGVDFAGNEGESAAPYSILPVKDLTAQRGADKVTLSWSDPAHPDILGFEVWRALWHDADDPSLGSAYPEYDDLLNNLFPTRPTTHTLALGAGPWERVDTVPLGAESFVDDNAGAGLERGIWLYEVYGIYPDDYYSGWSRTDALATSYLLGDLTGPGAVPDGDVTTADISVLGTAYGTFDGDGSGNYNNECDVGPTDDYTGSGVPVTDNNVEFEDLMIFSQNWDVTVTKTLPTVGNQMAKLSWEKVDESNWSLVLTEPCANLKGVNLRADLPKGAAISATAGSLLGQQENPYFLKNIARNGLDAGLALLGSGACFTGKGELIRIQLNGGELDPDDLEITARDHANQDLDYTLGETVTEQDLPNRYSLSTNYPNPFNPSTKIEFSLPEPQKVQLVIFGVDGRRVATLTNEFMPPGQYTVTWTGRDDRGDLVAAGIYFYRLQAGTFNQTKKMTLLK